jgi:predicted dehydrogenase
MSQPATPENQPAPRTVSRRTFLSRSSAAAGAGIALPYIIPNGVLAQPGKPGANDRIQVGHIGVGGRGTKLLGETLDNSGVEVVALCDIDDRAITKVKKKVGDRAKTYKDLRKLLEDKSIDAVVIATPDHWHALAMVWACQAGKDVYCEKPACNTIAEGQAMIKAARDNKRVVQIGSQGRSQPDTQKACEYIRNGQLGKVTKISCFHPLNPEGPVPAMPEGPPPPGVDWDMWIGPAAWRPYTEAIHPFRFRWHLDLGGGNIRDRGAHIFSCSLWFMDADHQPPVSVETIGAAPRFGQFNTPTLMQVTYEFKNPNWTLIWNQPGEQARYPGQPGYNVRHKEYGQKVFGSKDFLWMEGGDGGCTTEDKARKYEVPAGGKTVFHSPGHMQNFVDCIKSRQDPIMNIDAGVAVANLCIIGNLSYRLHRKLDWDGKNNRFVGDDEANKLLSNPPREPWVVKA